MNSLPQNPYFERPRKTLKTFFGKGENAGNQHFLLFQKCFLPYQRQVH